MRKVKYYVQLLSDEFSLPAVPHGGKDEDSIPLIYQS